MNTLILRTINPSVRWFASRRSVRALTEMVELAAGHFVIRTLGVGWLFVAGACEMMAADATSTPPVPPQRNFLVRYCFDCHDTDAMKGELDLTALPFDPSNATTFAKWVKVHDRLQKGEMPPKDEPRPSAEELNLFLSAIARPMMAADRQRVASDGRATLRRLNRYEYENTLRDLFGAPWLNIRDMLPEDGESYRFNKTGAALDVSHVQMSRYVSTADFVLRRVMAPEKARPPTTTVRYYTREQGNFVRLIWLRGRPNRKVWPVLGNELAVELLDRESPIPMTVGSANPVKREQEAMAVVVSTYQPTHLQFTNFVAPYSGRYRLRFSAYSLWMNPEFTATSVGRRDEPITLYAFTAPRSLRKLGSFDVGPNDTTPKELEVWLVAGESIRPDAPRLYRTWPPDRVNPNGVADGMPAVAYRWLEVEGPLLGEWPTAGHRLLFADLPLEETAGPAPAATERRPRRERNVRPDREGVPPPSPPAPHFVAASSTEPEHDAARLLHAFMAQTHRRPPTAADEAPFLRIIQGAMRGGHSFTDAMIAGYSAVLSSSGFLYLQETPGRLDDFALAARLSYFLWNSCPDETLRRIAECGELHRPDVLRTQTQRMLDDPKSRRFVDAFLDYWLDVRKVSATTPDAALYPDYLLDDMLVESMVEETQTFFAELLRRNLGACNLVSADFAMLNERLATHYGIPGVSGVTIRPVPLPAGGVRGGVLTQATVLKVTANGTTTSPVVRGAWVMERILGLPPSPPPATVSAVDPDTRGTTTIRDQLARHRAQASCAACHAKIDPAGFALENFDVMGAWRERYRSLGEGDPVSGVGHSGQVFRFKLAQPVDASGALPNGRAFHDIRELKRLLVDDEEQLARNFVQQLLVYATGAPARFSDRPAVEEILTRTRAGGYGLRSLIHELIQSEMFLNK